MTEYFLKWLTEIGLFFDLAAFAILSIDLTSSLKQERLARDEIVKLRRASFNTRYAILAPNHDVTQKEDADFNDKIDKEVRLSDQSMSRRRRLAYFAITLAAIGFILQLIGGWPGLNPS